MAKVTISVQVDEAMVEEIDGLLNANVPIPGMRPLPIAGPAVKTEEDTRTPPERVKAYVVEHLKGLALQGRSNVRNTVGARKDKDEVDAAFEE